MNRSLLRTVLPLLCLLLPGPTVARAGASRFLTVESSRPVFNVVYHWGQNTPDASGAYGANLHAPANAWFLEEERAGGVDVVAGVERHDPALVALGLKMFHWGLEREAADGSFPGSLWPFHGTALFLAEAAPALLLLKSAHETQFDAELRWETMRVRRAARHLITLAGHVGRLDDPAKNHRFYEAALALGASGVLAHDRALERAAAVYAREGMAMARPDGVMPEDGGHDSGYQALGMVYASRYMLLLAHGALYHHLYRVLQRGEAWELSRVGADGRIDQSGDTRTAGCKERNLSGACKTALYATIANALARWSVIAHSSRYERAAYAVWLQNWRLVPGDVLPPSGVFAQPTVVHRGEWLTVWGARFQPLETVRVYLGSTIEQTIQCDQTGTFGGHSAQPNARFLIPTVTPGRYTITARGSYGTVRRTIITVAG